MVAKTESEREGLLRKSPLLSGRACSNQPTPVAQLLQKLQLTGERKRGEVISHLTFAFQNLVQPVAHLLSPRNLSPNSSHFASNPWRVRIWSSLLASKTPVS